jgi:hypothetical protein
LYFPKASFESLELVVDGEEGFGDWLGGGDEVVDQGVGLAEEVEECLSRH